MDKRVACLRTPEECDQFVLNVQATEPELAIAARRRAVILRAESHGASSEVEREILAAIYAYEAGKSRETGRKFHASRTWQMVKRHGIIGTAERAVNRDEDAEGFQTLAKMGLQDLAFEAVIVRNPGRFTEGAVARAQERLNRWNALEQKLIIDSASGNQ